MLKCRAGACSRRLLAILESPLRSLREDLFGSIFAYCICAKLSV